MKVQLDTPGGCMPRENGIQFSVLFPSEKEEKCIILNFFGFLNMVKILLSFLPCSEKSMNTNFLEKKIRSLVQFKCFPWLGLKLKVHWCIIELCDHKQYLHIASMDLYCVENMSIL